MLLSGECTQSGTPFYKKCNVIKYDRAKKKGPTQGAKEQVWTKIIQKWVPKVVAEKPNAESITIIDNLTTHIEENATRGANVSDTIVTELGVIGQCHKSRCCCCPWYCSTSS